MLSSEQITGMFGFLEDVKIISKQLLSALTQQVLPTTSGRGIAQIFIEKVLSSFLF